MYLNAVTALKSQQQKTVSHSGFHSSSFSNAEEALKRTFTDNHHR